MSSLQERPANQARRSGSGRRPAREISEISRITRSVVAASVRFERKTTSVTIAQKTRVNREAHRPWSTQPCGRAERVSPGKYLLERLHDVERQHCMAKIDGSSKIEPARERGPRQDGARFAYHEERQQTEAEQQCRHDVKIAVIGVAFPIPNQPAFEPNSTTGSASAAATAIARAKQNPNRDERNLQRLRPFFRAALCVTPRCVQQSLQDKQRHLTLRRRAFRQFLAQRHARLDVGLARERVGDLLRSLDDGGRQARHARNFDAEGTRRASGLHAVRKDRRAAERCSPPP